jgi:hypothetical protein
VREIFMSVLPPGHYDAGCATTVKEPLIVWPWLCGAARDAFC